MDTTNKFNSARLDNIAKHLEDYKNKVFTTEEISLKLNENFYVVSVLLNDFVSKGILKESSIGTYEFQNSISTSKINAEGKEEKLFFGTISIHEKGYGFIMGGPNKEKFFVPPNKINGAIDNDRVSFSTFKDDKHDGPVAKVEAVISRKNINIVGIIKKSHTNGQLVFIPDSNNLSGSIIVKDKSAFILNHKVVLKIISAGNGTINCEFFKDLGHMNDKYVDIYSIIYAKGIPVDFSPVTITYCNNLKLEDADLKNRQDLTKKMFVTIDGNDSKDFDDAICVEPLEGDKMLLSVAIADVAHYVKENSPLDFDALNRGTSVYLIDIVVPMLPYALSNDLCSLNPNTKKLTLSVDIVIDKNGKIEKFDFHNSVIESKFRLTYDEVNAYFDNNFAPDLKNSFELSDMLKNAYKLYQILLASKINKGMILFESEEAKLKLDDQGKTSSVKFYECSNAEKLIEQFMILANECAGEFLLANKNLNGLYRVHASPQQRKLEVFDKIATIFDIPLPKNNKITNRFFQQTLADFENSQNKQVINLYLLKTLEKAKYDFKNIGHFGLASNCYTHFTSPIRRYPDLIVHRLLKMILENNLANNFSMNKKVMEEIALQSNYGEARAVDCEWDVVRLKKAEFLQNFLRQDFEGLIISVNKFGFFVALDNTIEGLVHISSLVDDEYEYDDAKLMLVGKNKKRIFKLGDKVQINVFNVLKHKGKIDFVLSDLKDKQPEQVANSTAGFKNRNFSNNANNGNNKFYANKNNNFADRNNFNNGNASGNSYGKKFYENKNFTPEANNQEGKKFFNKPYNANNGQNNSNRNSNNNQYNKFKPKEGYGKFNDNNFNSNKNYSKGDKNINPENKNYNKNHQRSFNSFSSKLDDAMLSEWNKTK